MISLKLIQDDFPKLIEDLAPRIEVAKEAIAEQIRADAEQASPPNLGIAGKWSVDHTGGGLKVKNSEWRAVFYEDGTPYMAAEPMLAPALDRAAPAFEVHLDKAFSE